MIACATTAADKRQIDFEEASAILDDVSVSAPGRTTQHSGVIYPARMEMYVAVSPAPGRSATKEPYTLVRWADVWSVAK